MVVEMVAREVGEGGRADRHAVDAALVEAMRRGLERKVVDARIGERG